MSVARACAVILSVLAITVLHSPALANGIGLTIQRIDASNFPTVRAYVSVATAEGIPIEGLGAESFQLLEDDQPIESFQIESIVDSQEPIAVALIIDVSGSMNDEGRIASAKQAAHTFIDRIGPQDRVAILSFNDQVRIVQGYTDDKAALKAAVDGLTAEGNTALYDAVFQAAQLQGALPQNRKVLLVLADGEDNASRQSLDASIAATKSGSAVAFVVGLGSAVQRDVLDKLAGDTGGQAIYVASAEQLGETFQGINNQLRRQYVLTYTSKLSGDDQPHNLAVKAEYSGQSAEARSAFTANRTPITFAVTGLANAGRVQGVQRIEVAPQGGSVGEIELIVDDELRATATSAPYVLEWDTSAEEPGIHRVIIRAKDATGTTTDQEFVVEVIGAAAAATTVPQPTAAVTAVVATPVPTPAPAPQPTTNPLIFLGAAVAALVLLGAIIGGVLLLRKRKITLPAEPQPTPKPEVSDRTEAIDLAPLPPRQTQPPPTPTPATPPPPPPPVQPTPAPQGTVVSEPAPQATLVGGSVGGETIAAGATIVAGQQTPRARLRIAQGTTQSEVVLDQAETMLGRESGNAVVVRDPMASRRHARIVNEDGEYWIEDLKSLNGTRVNGEVITKRKLAPNDQIKIGDVILTFVIE